MLLRELIDSTLAVVFPTQCCLCKSELQSDGRLRICRTCWSGLRPWNGAVCARCGLPAGSPHALDSVTVQCADCRLDVPRFEAARSFGLYRESLRKAIVRLKFGRDERLGIRLGELLAFPWAQIQRGQEFGAPVILPIPLHPSRRRERGYNQSELLATGLMRTLKRHRAGAPSQVRSDVLCRKRATLPQTGLSVAARRENVRGVFEVMNPSAIRDRLIVVIDDVMTTGATVSAAARALRRAGSAQVLAITLARATPQFPDLSGEDRDNTVDGLDRDWT